MVINNNAKSNKLQDQVFWYHAESRPNFKLGSKEFWDLSKNMDEEDNSEEYYDPTKPKNKSHQKINVKKSKW
jgi:predicted RNA-binding protein with PUA-like domain